MLPLVSRRSYVQRVLDLYRLAPGARGPLRRCDRQLAGALHDRGVALEVVYAAMLLAITRKTLRPPAAPPLAHIATLHYFQPVIDELIEEPPQPGYVNYLRHKLATVAPDFVAASDHQLP